jgi:hypothetical protein
VEISWLLLVQVTALCIMKFRTDLTEALLIDCENTKDWDFSLLLYD